MSNQVLPSAESALAFVRGEPNAIFGVARDMAMRSTLIGIGLYAAGERKKIVKKAVFGAAAIEVAVLALAWAKKDHIR